jgi:GNAT superfamily N-acetyltransferase
MPTSSEKRSTERPVTSGTDPVVEVRRVRPDEWQEVKQVRLAMLADTPSAFVTTIDEALAHDDQVWIERAAIGSVGDAQATVLAVGADGPVGMAVGLGKERFDVPVLVIVSVFVAEPYRGTGVAEEIFNQLEAWGRSWGASNSTLWVEDGNDRALGFYRKIGYRTTIDRAKLPNDSGLWETRMEKPLGNGD